ncbi:MAG: polymorphic toxin type 23 domain-containing protein [Saprospiraceae bacterium]
MQKKEWILLAFIFCHFSMLGQVDWTDNLGGRIGVTIQLGKPVNRIGLVASIFYHYDFVELDLEWRGQYNFSNYGPPLKGWESQITTGVTFAMGKKDTFLLPFAMPFFQHTGRKYAINYALHFYQDQIETSQRSGTIALQFDRVHIVMENDAFGSFHGGDEFRTGAFSVFYQKKNWLYELKTVLWTGITSGEGTQTFRETDYPCRFGYRDICGAKHGRFSHGVLAGQVHRYLDNGQTVQVGIGVDSERVRNFIQNKLIHDMYFFPASWTKVRNLHIPMLDENGNAFTYQVGQKIKPASWYLNIALNGGGSY